MTTTMPEVGAEAPLFETEDQNANSVRLADLKGKWVVLYFYPRDNTPGCTREACNFRDNYSDLQAEGAVVLGVSGGSATSKTKFAEKYELPFPLLLDSEHEIARAYGAFGLKKNYGREYEGITRSTVLIDPEGKVAKVWPKVKPDDHGAQVLEWLRGVASSD